MAVDEHRSTVEARQRVDRVGRVGCDPEGNEDFDVIDTDAAQVPRLLLQAPETAEVGAPVTLDAGASVGSITSAATRS